MKKFFTYRSLLALLASIGLAESSTRAACWYPDEIVADQVKDFQYMLMVGAIQCRNTATPANEAYNSFVTRQHGVLDSKSIVLKGHFLRENGLHDARSAYDEHNTMMSNRHAGRFDDGSFCQTIATYTHMAATSSDQDFIVLAESVIEPPESSCASVAYAPPLPVPPPLRRPEPLPAYVPAAAAPSPYGIDPYAPALAAADPYPVETAATMEPAPLPVAFARPAAPLPSARTTVIADAPVVAPGGDRAASSPVAALQAAITALQAATAALRAQAGPTD